jgi:hypothetical protein
MIQEIQNANTAVDVRRAENAYTAAPENPAPTNIQRDPATTVEVSETAKTVSSILNDLPKLNLNPEFHLKNAQSELKALLNQFGISSNEEVGIETKGDGRYTLSGEHPLLSEVEKLINSDDRAAADLRNSLAGAYNGSIIQHIGKAVEMAMAGADANPARAETYYNWIVSVSKGTKNMQFSMTLSNGEMTGSLVDRTGRTFAAGEGLKLPA